MEEVLLDHAEAWEKLAKGDNKTMKNETNEIEVPVNPFPWPDPSPEDLQSPEFEAIWQTIKTWDINVPEVYNGYCGATGNHVKAILGALKQSELSKDKKDSVEQARQSVISYPRYDYDNRPT